MTPAADYRCVYCAAVVEYSWVGGDAPAQLHYPHPTSRGVQCANHTLDRVWTPVGIGQVPGAGGSPARNRVLPREGVDDE